MADRDSLLSSGRVVSARLTIAETQAWDAYCNRLGMTGSKVLRALVREVLGLDGTEGEPAPTVAVRIFDSARRRRRP